MSGTRLRVLTAEGIEGFDTYIESLRQGGTQPPPVALLTDGASSAIGPSTSVDLGSMRDRLSAARALVAALKPVESWAGGVSRHRGLWAWLALACFDTLCPAVKGSRKVLETAKYIPPALDVPGAFRKYHRHLLAGPYLLYRAHGEGARLFLSGPLHVHPDVAEQIAARMERVSNQGVIEVMDRLYFDAARCRPKQGITPRNNPGTLRRLIACLDQFDLTYDLQSMSADQILALLPEEFEVFKG